MATRRRSTGRTDEPRPERVDRLEVESFESAFGEFARVGRNIFFRGTLGPDEHRAFLQRLLSESVPELEARQRELRTRLDEILAEVDPVDLVARAAFIYLPIDPNTFKEWENDSSPAHVEFLGLQVVPLIGEPRPADLDPMTVASLTSEALVVTRDLFDVTGQLITLRQVDPARQDTDQRRDYRVRTQLDALSVRGSAYAEHSRAILQGTLGQFDTECKDDLGFTAEQAVDLMHGMVDVVADRVAPLAEQAEASRQEMLRALPRQRRKGTPGPVPEWIVAMKPNDAKRFVAIITRVWLFHAARALQTVSVQDLTAQCALPPRNVQAFLDAFACPINAYDPIHHLMPVGAHPLTERPILKTDDGYILLVPSSMLEAVRPRMETLLQATRHWEPYVHRRAGFVEAEAVRRLSNALPGSDGATGLRWKSPTDESDLDGLVTVDDFAFRLQCKAGRLHAATRRGAPGRMQRNLDELIREAARQHAALAKALAETGADGIGLGVYRESLEGAPFQVEVIVCLDDLTVWSTHAHELRRIGALPSDRPVPWIISLSDLMAATDLLSGAQLLHFVTRRLRLETLGKVFAHDELDWVGHYILEGLYFEHIFGESDAPDRYRLLSYTEPIDAWYFTREGLRTVPAPKPAQPMGPNLAKLVSRLERQRPRHWTVAGMALLMGDLESRNLWESLLLNARDRRLTHGWSNGSQVFLPQVVVTYFMDFRPPRERFAERLGHYVSEKMATTPTRSWIAIGYNGDQLFIDVRSHAADGLVALFQSIGIDRRDGDVHADIDVDG